MRSNAINEVKRDWRDSARVEWIWRLVREAARWCVMMQEIKPRTCLLLLGPLANLGLGAMDQSRGLQKDCWQSCSEQDHSHQLWCKRRALQICCKTLNFYFQHKLKGNATRTNIDLSLFQTHQPISMNQRGRRDSTSFGPACLVLVNLFA